MSDFKLTDELKNAIKAELRDEIKKELAAELREEIIRELNSNAENEGSGKVATEVKAEAVKSVETKIEEVKATEAKVEEVKTEEVNANETRDNEVKAEETKSEDTKAEEANSKEAKSEENKSDEVKAGEAKTEEAKLKEAKSEEIKTEEVSSADTKSETPETDNKKLTFKKGLIIYVIIWLIITLLVCLYLWKSMSGYQKNYDAAKAAANPDIVAEVCMEQFKLENIASIAREQFPEVSPYETDANWQYFFKSSFDEDSLSYNRVENFSATNPEYQVYAGDKLVGSFKLVETGDADAYGFHNFAVKSTSIDIELPELKNYKIEVLDGDQVIINGNDITNMEIAKVEKVSDSVHDAIAEKTGVSFNKAEYVVSGFIEEPVVNVVDKGNECQVEVNGDEFKYYAAYDVNLFNDVQDRIITADKSYIQVMNLVSQFAVVSGYLVPYGDAYKAIQSAMSGLAWAGAPEEFEIKDSEIKEMWQYDDDNFVVVSHYAIHRVYRGETYEEEMTIENHYTKLNGIWLIQDMALKR